MGRPTEAQWFCAREVSEGEPSTRVRVAAMLGVDVSAVYMRAAAEGWKTVDFRNREIQGLYREAQAIAAGLSGREPPEAFDDDGMPAAPGADAGLPEAGGAWPEAGAADGASGLAGAARTCADEDAGRAASEPGVTEPGADSGPGVDSESGADRRPAEVSGADGERAGDPGAAGTRQPEAGVAGDDAEISGSAGARPAQQAGAGVAPHAGERPAGGAPALPGRASLGIPQWDRLEPVELLANASGFVARQIGRLIANAERRGGRLDRAQIEGLAALAKMMDRWEALAAERAKQDRSKSDEDLADIFARITDKILELAKAEAERLRGRDRARRARPRRRGGVVRPGAAGPDPALAAG